MAKKKKNTRNLIIFISIVVIGIIVAASLMNNKDKPVEVAVEKVANRTIVQKVSAVGKIQAETEVKVSPETSGEVVYLGVEEGDSVKKGQLLIRIKPDIIETMLEQYRASVEAAKLDAEAVSERVKQAETELKRARELYKNKYISQQEFDTYSTNYQTLQSNYQSSIARYQQSKASLKQIEKNAERTTIFAPIDGVITARNVEIGETVLGTQQFQGTEMLRVSDLNVMNAIVEVDENDIILIQKGDTASIEVDALPDLILKGIVIEIGHSAIQSTTMTQDQSTNFNVKVRIINPDPKLRPGMSCNAEITTETKYDAIAVPLQSVTTRVKFADDVRPDGIQQVKDSEEDKIKKRPPMIVFIQEKDIVRTREVKTGISDDGYIEITDGLKLGETVVSGSFQAISKLLDDSVKVTLENKDKKKAFKKKM
jgi:HlyD family secretion protein